MSRRRLLVLLVCLFASGLACGFAVPVATAAEWQRDWLVPGGPFRGVHGMVVGPDGKIRVGSVMGQTTYLVDPDGGSVETLVPAPDGEADDLELADDGTLYFTGFMNGTLTARRPDGTLEILARDLPGMNSLALDPRGRLFATQVFVGDALWEIDRAGKAAPRRVREDLGGLNGFDFGPDGRLCGPLWFRHQVVCLDVDGGALEVVADGFVTPAAANFDPKGVLHAIDNGTGEVFRIDPASKKKTRIATAPTNLDNLAFGPDGRLFLTNMPDNAIYEVDRESGAIRLVVGSPLTLPGGIARAGGTLYVADTFALSAVDLATGAVRDLGRDDESSGSPSIVAANATHLATASLHRGSVTLFDLGSQQVVARFTDLGQPLALAFALDEVKPASRGTRNAGPGDEKRDGRTAGLAASVRLVVATAKGELIELDPAKPAARRVLARDLDLPMGLAGTAKGFLVGEAGAGRLVELRDDGSRRIVASDLAHPEGLALLADGRVAVAEPAAKRVTLVDPSSGRKETIATDLPLGLRDLPTQPNGLFPTGLAVAEDGALLLSSDVKGGILRLRPPK